jgi:hypothetical protein
MNYIVTTTIYPESKALKLFQQKQGWKLIVVGDKKTPHEEYIKNPNIIYLTPEYQETQYNELSELIGWNCTARRNIGYVEAIHRGAGIIASIDDDNVPHADWGSNLMLNTTEYVKHYTSVNRNVFDPLSPTNYNHLWHRGYPIEYVFNKNNLTSTFDTITPDIQADFWNGDPDVDAIERMVYSPTCIFDDDAFPFASTNISPFNSQNTFLTKKAIRDYFMFPETGRMEDIWAAYYCISKGNKVVYNKATVTQERNPHDYLKDFNDEILGYTNNARLINKLIESPENITEFITHRSYRALRCYQTLMDKVQ